MNELLLKQKIGKVVVTGLQSQYCVIETCIGANEPGYEVVLVKYAHSNNSSNAAEIIQQVNSDVMNNNITSLISTTEIIFKYLLTFYIY